MRALIIKVVAMCACFALLMGVGLPWLISNAILPLWADVMLISLIVCAWIVTVDKVTNHALKNLKRTGKIYS